MTKIQISKENIYIYLRRWSEIIFADFHEVVDFSNKLGVDRKSAVKFAAWLSNESLRKLLLEHQHGNSKNRPVK